MSQDIRLDPISHETYSIASSVAQRTVADDASLVGLSPSATQDIELEPVSSAIKSPTNFPDGGWKAYSVVLGSHIGLIINFGILNAIGAVQAYIASHQLAGENVSDISWVFSIYMCLPFLLGVFVGPIFDSQGSTVLLLISTVLLFVGFMAVSVSNSVIAFIFSLSICMGTAHALAITPLVSLVSHWFLLHRGQALGLASLGGSIGGAIWPLVLRALYSSVGFSWGIRIVAFICLFGLIISVVLVKLRFRRDISPPGTENMKKSKKVLMHTKEFFDLTAFKEPSFVFLVLGVFFTEIALLSMVTYLASFAIAQGFTEDNSLLLVTIFNALGIPGRYIPGYLGDKYGNFNVMVTMLTGFSISLLAVLLPFGQLTSGLYAFSIMGGFFSSSILSLTPVCLGSITQVDKFGQRYGLMYTCSSTGILFGIPVGAAIIGKSTLENYKMFTVFCGIFAVVGTMCWTLSRYFVVGAKLNVKV